MWSGGGLLSEGCGQEDTVAMGIYNAWCAFCICRQLALNNFSTKMMILFITSILTIPGSLVHLQKLSPEVRREGEREGFYDCIHMDADFEEAEGSEFCW